MEINGVLGHSCKHALAIVGLTLNFDKSYFQALGTAVMVNETEFPGGPG